MALLLLLLHVGIQALCILYTLSNLVLVWGFCFSRFSNCCILVSLVPVQPVDFQLDLLPILKSDFSPGDPFRRDPPPHAFCMFSFILYTILRKALYNAVLNTNSYNFILPLK